MATHPRQCPCKLLPQCLSCFTAAEFGDLQSLSSKPDVAHKVGLGGLTPLHYAAQNDKASATAYLLGLGADVDGRPRVEDMSISTLHQSDGSGSSGRAEMRPTKEAWCGATPLHRASFSGAVSAMQILLEWGSSKSFSAQTSIITGRRQCDILAQDTSFGDKMTPLHKAAAGGRHLAVQLLVETLRSRSRQGHEWRDLLRRSLMALDSQGRTPLEVAKAIDPMEEAKNVKRWDSVAGGTPDWTRCIAILESAEQEAVLGRKSVDTSAPNADLPALPAHLLDTTSCFDCGADDGTCKTASWEAAFRIVLASSAMHASARTSYMTIVGNASAEQKGGDTQRTGVARPAESTSCAPSTNTAATSSINTSTRVGNTCNVCNRFSLVLFRTGGTLVCKKCRGKQRSRRNNVITVVKMM